MKPEQACVVFTTCGDDDTAAHIAKTLVENKLAACVNILPNVRSIYTWNGEIQDDKEVLLVIKTLKANYSALETWCQAHHPYDVPELIQLDVTQALPAYLNWINKTLGAL